MFRRYSRSLLLLLLTAVLVSLSACDSQDTYELNGSTMGTGFSVMIVADRSPDLFMVQMRIESILSEVNEAMSTYDPGSEISRFNELRHTNYVSISEDLCKVFDAANRVGELTEGAFDITIAPVVNAWGFGPDERQHAPPANFHRNCAPGNCRLDVDCSTLVARKADAGIEVDLSGIAKGFAVDQVSLFLSTTGFNNHLVEIGGEVRVAGRRESNENWQIGVESPDLGKAFPTAALSISDIAMATSGDYRNFFEYEGHRYSHLIDPATERPATNLLVSVTVLHESAMIADALATGLFVLGADRGFEVARTNGLTALFVARTDSGLVRLKTDTFP